MPKWVAQKKLMLIALFIFRSKHYADTCFFSEKVKLIKIIIYTVQLSLINPTKLKLSLIYFSNEYQQLTFVGYLESYLMSAFGRTRPLF